MLNTTGEREGGSVYLCVKDCGIGAGSGSDSRVGVGTSWGDMAASSPLILSGVKGDCISPGADS